MTHEAVPARQMLRSVIRARREQMLTCEVRVAAVVPLSERFTRVVLQGDGLGRYRDGRPADAFKLHLPGAPHVPVPLPDYDESGRLRWPTDAPRPLARCFTVRESDPDRGRLSFDALVHPEGATAQWLAAVDAGDRLSLTGMRTEFVDPAETARHLLIGDASAIPVIGSIVAGVSPLKPVTVVLDAPRVDADLLPAHPRLDLRWADGRRLVEVVRALRSVEGPRTQVWVGAEATQVHDVRRHLHQLGVHPDALHASAYWKRDQDWEAMFDESLERFVVATNVGLDTSDPGILQRLTFDPGPIG